MTSRTRRVALVPLVSTLLLLPAAAGCAQGRDYALPRDICGVKLPQDVIDPLLPDGEKLGNKRERREFRGDAHFVRCTVTVDGKGAVYATLYEMPEVAPHRTGKNDPHHSDRPEPLKNLPFSGWADVTDDDVRGSTLCRDDPEGRSDALSFEVTLQKTKASGSKERRAAGERFIKKFIPREKKKEHCTAD